MTDPFDTADFYDCDEYADVFQHTTPRDAVEHTWQDFAPENVRDDDPVTVYAYKRAEWPSAQRIADEMFYVLSEGALLEDTRDPENTMDRKPMFAAALLHAAEVFRHEYKVWHCVQVGKRTLSLREWRAVNNG